MREEPLPALDDGGSWVKFQMRPRGVIEIIAWPRDQAFFEEFIRSIAQPTGSLGMPVLSYGECSGDVVLEIWWRWRSWIGGGQDDSERASLGF